MLTPPEPRSEALPDMPMDAHRGIFQPSGATIWLKPGDYFNTMALMVFRWQYNRLHQTD
jgi:hypothetical protein